MLTQIWQLLIIANSKIRERVGRMDNLTERLQAKGIEVRGAFDVQRFYETIAKILSARYDNMEITVKVIKKEGKEQGEKVI